MPVMQGKKPIGKQSVTISVDKWVKEDIEEFAGHYGLTFSNITQRALIHYWEKFFSDYKYNQNKEQRISEGYGKVLTDNELDDFLEELNDNSD